jgi:DNA-binding transcriptional LysR family regulator
MQNLNDLRMFVRAVDSGGFAAAARLIGSPKSTISKRVAELEAELGARLIYRTSRSFTLTDLGREFYIHAQAALVEAEAAERAVRQRLAEPAGKVRVTASVPDAQFRIAGRLPAFTRAYPRVGVELHVTDRFVDLVHEGFDIALRSHMAPLPDSGLVQKRLLIDPIILVAAPSYTADRGAPHVPSDLSEHQSVNAGAGSEAWRLADGYGNEVTVSPPARVSADEAGVLLHLAKTGLGIVRLPETVARSGVEQGDLVRVLPGWTAGTITTTVLTPQQRGQLPAVRALIDFLATPVPGA